MKLVLLLLAIYGISSTVSTATLKTKVHESVIVDIKFYLEPKTSYERHCITCTNNLTGIDYGNILVNVISDYKDGGNRGLEDIVQKHCTNDLFLFYFIDFELSKYSSEGV